MINYIVFDGENSLDYGVYVSGQKTFNAPARVYESQTIPGRNGAIVTRADRLDNAVLVYSAFIVRNFELNARKLRNFLVSRTSYCRLMDTYHPDEYRMAIYREGLDIDVTDRNNAGRFELTFDCKPQRFLLAGEEVRSFTTDGSIYNPTLFESKPLIRVYGTGVLGLGNGTITITDADSYTDIDCDIMAAYKGAVNKNQYVQMSGLDFPGLPPGDTGIALGEGITKVEITPRWWEV